MVIVTTFPTMANYRIVVFSIFVIIVIVQHLMTVWTNNHIISDLKATHVFHPKPYQEGSDLSSAFHRQPMGHFRQV